MSGRYTPQFLDEIRSRLSVSQVVGRKVALKKKGREWAGLSPFKTEKTPSFFVNDQKGFYHCFASGEHGDIFTFLMKTEGLQFAEAVERLAGEAGLQLPQRDRVQEEIFHKRLSLYDVMKAAVEFYVRQLQSNIGKDARDYLAQRGILPATQAVFEMGYAPANRTALKTELLAKGFNEGQLLECGLLIQPENGDAPYDRFRDRVMIPIQDHRGRTIAFGGRALRSDMIPKYLNSPETPLFIKGHTVFNFHRARQPAFETDDVIVVEGYLDAIAIYQAGLRNVAASLGTALTEAQIKALWQLASSPTICFDGDRAGKEAAFKAVPRMLPMLKPERSFRFAFMVGAKDPDELIRGSGVAAFSKIIAEAIPLHDAMWLAETETANPSTPERKAAFEKQIYRLINSIEDQDVRRQYINTFRVRLSKFFWDNSSGGKKTTPRKALYGLKSPDGTALDATVLGMSVEYTDLFDAYHERFLDIAFSTKYTLFVDALFNVLVTCQGEPVSSIYEQISPVFYDVLDDVHGDQQPEKGLRYGHRLRQRCPVLKLEPDASFVDRLFLMLVAKLSLRSQKRELDELQTTAATDDDWQRVLRLKRDFEVAEAANNAEETELDAIGQEMGKRFHTQRVAA